MGIQDIGNVLTFIALWIQDEGNTSFRAEVLLDEKTEPRATGFGYRNDEPVGGVEGIFFSA